MLTIKNTADGVLQIIEIKGNSIIDESNGEKIKSVGDKIEGENLYKISLLSTNGLSKSNINYKECEVEILLPVQLERVDDIYDRLIFNTEGVWIVEKNVNAVIENGIIVNKQVESNIISLPDLELSPLYSFKGDTTIDFLTEVNGSIKVNVPKILTGIINDHTNQINDNANQINGFNVELDKLSSQLEHKVSSFQGSENAGKILVVDKNGYLTSIPSEYVTETELATKGYLTEHQDISHLALKTELHNHSNKSVLDNITSAKVTEWNSKSDLSLGDTSSTAYRGDLGNKAYTHSQSAHAPSNAQKNSDITKAEIEAKLVGNITTHTHNYITESEVDEKINLQLDIDYDSILSFDTQETIIDDNAIGYIDNNNKVVIRDILPYGEYSLKYDYEDGTQVEIKKFTIKNSNENLMKIGEIYLNQRYSKSGGGLVSDSNSIGMFSIIFPFETDGVKTHALRFDNLKSSITVSNNNTLFLLDSNKKNPMNVNGANEFPKMTQGVTVLDGGTSATVEFIGDTTKKYIVINLVVKSTEITLKDIEDYIITLH